MSKNIIIAIDGPAGSGKSTAAKKIAEKLGFLYLDTGAMYRALTYAVLKLNVIDDEEKIIQLAKSIKIELEFVDGNTKVTLNGEDVSEAIRSQEVNNHVSQVSTIPQVREELVIQQQRIGAHTNLVTEGRDTTTAVFPGANLKFFLTSSIEKRAKRRFKEFQEKYGKISLEEVMKNLQERDEIDSQRKTSPLTKADDAIEIDTTDLTIDDEVEIIINKVKEIYQEIYK